MRSFLFLGIFALAGCGADNFTVGSDASPESGSADGSSPEAGDGGDRPFSVRDLAGLVLWLNPSSIQEQNGRVALWQDQSGSNNHASAPPGLEPSPGTSFDGFASVRFRSNATNQLAIAPSPSLEWGMADFYLVIVARFDNDAMNAANPTGVMFLRSNNQPAMPALGILANVPQGVPAPGAFGLTEPTQTVSIQGPFNDNAARAYALHRHNGTLELRVSNMSSMTASSTTNLDNPGVPIRLGSMGDSQAVLNTRLDGEMAEVIAVRAPNVPDLEIKAIEDYLKAKYKLP